MATAGQLVNMKIGASESVAQITIDATQRIIEK